MGPQLYLKCVVNTYLRYITSLTIYPQYATNPFLRYSELLVILYLISVVDTYWRYIKTLKVYLKCYVTVPYMGYNTYLRHTTPITIRYSILMTKNWYTTRLGIQWMKVNAV